MKKFLLIVLAALILSSCKTPNYGAGKEFNHVIEKTTGTEVATYNGYVIEVTDDNIIRVKVPKKDEMIQKGWAINEEGIVKIALASIKLPTDNLPLSYETNTTVKKLLLDKEITLDIIEETATSVSENSNPFNQIQGYIHLKDSNTTIQEVLIENGLAIIDQNSPFVKSYLRELEKLQAVAQNKSVGVWAIDGFVNLNNTLGGYFTNATDLNEEEIQSIIKDIKVKGLDLETIIYN
ncbi:thermonuclease family protein [Lysinibacillus capsici]|uniref:thermonuclease family protein n=1 Tax=Lysinibacillus capsici TaxID=2115968 RepID=UPI003D012E26